MADQPANPDLVELARRALVARRRDFPESFTPDVRLDLSVRVFNPDVYEGYEGILRWRSEVGEIWDSYVSEMSIRLSRRPRAHRRPSPRAALAATRSGATHHGRIPWLGYRPARLPA